MRRALITHRSFGSSNREAVERVFNESGWEIFYNPTDKAMSESEIINCVNRQEIESILVYSSADQLTRKVFEACPTLRIVSRHGVGIDNIDVIAASENGIEVRTTIGGQDFHAVADLTFGLLLSVARQIVLSDHRLRQGIWQREKAVGVWGKTLGIIGYGRIGQAVARRARGFDMKILIFDPYLSQGREKHSQETFVDFQTLLRMSDFITLHCNATVENREMINKDSISLMKKGVVLVNTARSSLVNQKDLLEALKSGRLSAAATDVFDNEPATADPLVTADLANLVLTPHLGPYTKEVLEEMDIRAAENLFR